MQIQTSNELSHQRAYTEKQKSNDLFANELNKNQTRKELKSRCKIERFVHHHYHKRKWLSAWKYECMRYSFIGVFFLEISQESKKMLMPNNHVWQDKKVFLHRDGQNLIGPQRKEVFVWCVENIYPCTHPQLPPTRKNPRARVHNHAINFRGQYKTKKEAQIIRSIQHFATTRTTCWLTDWLNQKNNERRWHKIK